MCLIKLKILKHYLSEWVYKETNNFKEKLQLEKLYCDKFKTNYALWEMFINISK